MKRILNIIPVLFFVISAFAIYQDKSGSAEKVYHYKLVWEDNFNGRVLDTTHWERIKRLSPDWSKYMSTHDRLYRLRKGYLRLYCMKNDFDRTDTASVVTGGIQTKDHYHFKGWGKMEVRARMHSAQGCWPAIWITSVLYQVDPRWAEIDIMEHYDYRNEVVQTAHNTYASVQNKQKESEHSYHPKVDPRQWNIYGVEILPTELRFTLNGKVTYVYKKINDPKVKYQYPYGTESYLRIDMQWANKWLKHDAGTLPAWMDIDWVRYYKLD